MPAAAEPRDADDAEDGERADLPLGQQARSLTQKSAALPQAAIDTTRVRDVNETAPSQAVVQTVRFHPSGQLALTAGYDKTLRLFQVDGRTNALVQSVFFGDMPIYDAAFSPDGRSIVACGRRKFFYSYDVEAGLVDRIPGILGAWRDKATVDATPCGVH